MKKDKRIIKLARELATLSFIKGVPSEAKVSQAVKSLKKFPSAQAILALTEYLKFIKLEIAKSTLRIESGSNLNRQEQIRIFKKLSTKFPITGFVYVHNSALLGGLSLKLGDTLYDYSLKGSINMVKEAITQ